MSVKNNLAFIFPGQGSQKVGMMSSLAETHPEVNLTFAEASEALGYDLWQKVLSGTEQELNQTECTQPALLSASIAAWRVWQRLSADRPAYLAGHSLGEWSALVAAGVVSFADAVSLVRLRGRYMQEAVPAGVGAMAAVIGLSDELVEKACFAAQEQHRTMVAAAVNYNCPQQLVIAGHAAAVETAMQLAKDFGAKRCLLLPVSAPFHTSLMAPAAKQLGEEIQSTVFAAPSIPIIHNVTKHHESDPNKIRQLMVEQICSPVPWVECIQKLRSLGVDTMVECGPGRVLAGLCRRIDRNLNVLSIETADDMSTTYKTLSRS